MLLPIAVFDPDCLALLEFVDRLAHQVRLAAARSTPEGFQAPLASDQLKATQIGKKQRRSSGSTELWSRWSPVRVRSIAVCCCLHAKGTVWAALERDLPVTAAARILPRLSSLREGDGMRVEPGGL
jgi:hypothetical protein